MVVAIALALAGLSSAVVSAAPAAPPAPGELLVGFDDPASAAFLSEHGGVLKRAFAGGKVALVHADDAAGLAKALARHPGVRYVEPNQPLYLDHVDVAASTPAASTWDASTWDASTWDASTWDASTWDASTWDASTWDASTWDASTWDASTWDASTWDASTWDASTWDANGTMDPGFDAQWGLGAVHAPHAWETTYGSGSVTVCVLDTGVDTAHPDLQVNLLRDASGAYGYNAMDGSANVTDDHGHGTHVAGIMAATGGNGIGITGMVRAKVLMVKVMGANGGTEADLIAGLDHCVSRGAKVASMSLHVTEDSLALREAIQRAQSAGMLLVAAAGNGASSAIPYPAAYTGVLAVGAVNPNGTVASFSNYGPDLDLVAPGYRIGSTALGGGYKMGSGTSQAVPFVSGAAALAWEANPSLTASQVSAILTGGARDLGAAGYDQTSGHGVVDAHEAVLQALAS